MPAIDTAAYRSAGAAFYRDMMNILLQPKDFFQTLPERKSAGDAVRFLCICAGIYSIAATVFAHENHLLYFFMFLLNALFIPVVTATGLYMVLYASGTKTMDYARTFQIVAYAGVTLLFAWIPGMAPFAEIFKYYLIGAGLVKTGRISIARTIGTLLATIALLFLALYMTKALTGLA